MAPLITRGAVRSGFDDDADDPPVRALTQAEALALRAKNPLMSPWRVVGIQALIGAVLAVVAWLAQADAEVVWSVLFGAATVVLPGALMARGMTSPLTSVSPGASAVGVMGWSTVKVGVSVAMLMLAPRLVQPLSWPALLASMVLCMQVYWLALLWRGR